MIFGTLSFTINNDLHCSAANLFATSYMEATCLLRLLLTIIWWPPTHSFTPGLKPSFSANPPHCSPSFLLLKYSLHGFPGLFSVISEHICFLLLVFSVFTRFGCRFRACGRLSWLMLAFERTLIIASRIVSYRIVQVRPPKEAETVSPVNPHHSCISFRCYLDDTLVDWRLRAMSTFAAAHQSNSHVTALFSRLILHPKLARQNGFMAGCRDKLTDSRIIDVSTLNWLLIESCLAQL